MSQTSYHLGRWASVLAAPVMLAGIGICQEKKQLRWVGCGITRKAFMGKLATEWEKQSGVKIVTEGGGASRGIRDVAAGKAELGGTCRHRLPIDIEKDAKLHPVAWDAIVVIAHPDNPVQSIRFEQLRKLLSGEIKSWAELGGPHQPVKLFVRKSAKSGVGLMARELIFWDSEFQFEGAAKEFKSSGPLEKALEQEKWGVALTGISSAKKRKVKVLQVNGKDPSVENIVNGSYPIVRPLYLVSARKPDPQTQAFLSWAKGPAQKFVAGEGTVTLAQGKKLWAKYNRLMKLSRMKNRRARPGK